MARSKTTFRKLVCSKCGHKHRDPEICFHGNQLCYWRKGKYIEGKGGCSCQYSISNVRDDVEITLPNKKVEKVNDIQREYILLQLKNRTAASEGRYIPKVKITPPKIEHKRRGKGRIVPLGMHSARRKGNLLTVKHKSTLGRATNAKRPSVLKGRRNKAKKTRRARR